MARDRATRAQIITEVRQRLIAEIEEWTQSTCFVADSPNPLTVPPGDSFCVISPGSARVADQFYAGAGHLTLTLHAQLRITIWKQHAIDTAGRLHESMLQEDNGLIQRYEVRLLRALLNDEWEPIYDGNELLRDAISLSDIGDPMLQQTPEGLSYVGLTYTFLTVFDYDLRST